MLVCLSVLDINKPLIFHSAQASVLNDFKIAFALFLLLHVIFSLRIVFSPFFGTFKIIMVCCTVQALSALFLLF